MLVIALSFNRHDCGLASTQFTSGSIDKSDVVKELSLPSGSTVDGIAYDRVGPPKIHDNDPYEGGQ